MSHALGMTPEEAREAIAAAVRERAAARASWVNAREHLYDVIREASGVLLQKEIAALSGYSRERIRLLTVEQGAPKDPETG
jgi:hypothetical protein